MIKKSIRNEKMVNEISVYDSKKRSTRGYKVEDVVKENGLKFKRRIECQILEYLKKQYRIT